MEQALVSGIPVFVMGLLAWYIQNNTSRSQKHIDQKFDELSKAIEGFRRELSHNTEINTDAHGKLWDAHRSSTRELGERIAKLEAVQGNCRTCGGRD